MGRPETAVRATALFVGVAYGLALYWAGIRLEPDLRRILAYLPSLAILGLVAWDVQVWRWPLIHRITSRPRLDGLWRASLSPTAESHIPPGGNRGPISAYMAISQSYWRLGVRVITQESHSVTRSHFWSTEASYDLEWVTFVYENAPQQRVQERSKRHLGTCTLQPGSKVPVRMNAAYFTDRYTQGDIELELVGRDGSVAAFADAQRKEVELRRQSQKGAERKKKLRGILGLDTEKT